MPAFDFNIARAYDRMGRTEQALAAYRRYAESQPTPADLDEVRERIRTLEQRGATSEKLARGPLASAPPTDRALGRTKKIGGLAVGGVGVAGLALGVTFAVLASSANHDLGHGG